MSTPTLEKTFTVEQVAQMLQLSQRTIYRWINGERLDQKKLRVIEIPGRGRKKVEYRIPISALEEMGFKREEFEG